MSRQEMPSQGADRFGDGLPAGEPVVHLGPVPQEILAELPVLYSSLRTTPAWFGSFDGAIPNGVCILSRPRHLLVFHRTDVEVNVLTKGIEIAPSDASKACGAIFEAVPAAKRIRIEVPFPPRRLGLPNRLLATIHPMVVDLPATEQEYYASLGARTRKNIRNYGNRLKANHPDLHTSVETPDADGMRRFVDQFVTWNIARMRAQGRTSGFVTDAARRDKVLRLMIEGGARVLSTEIDGRLAAVEFIHHTGDCATIYAGSFDPRYTDDHLGFLSTYWAIGETVRSGARQCNLLWTSEYYKGLLGARPTTANRLSVYRTERDRLLALNEVRQVRWRQAKEYVRAKLGK